MTMNPGTPFNPLDPMVSLLLSPIQKILEKLAEAGYEKAREAIRRLTHAGEKELRQAFDRAWEQAGSRQYGEDLEKLLKHRPFQDAVAVGLLDPIEGFNLEAAREVWGGKLPEQERSLKEFFRNLEKLLLRDEHWKPLLEGAHQYADDEKVRADLQRSGGWKPVEELVRQVIIIQNQQNAAKGGAVVTGKDARVYIFNQFYLQPSGERKLDDREFDRCLGEYLEWVETSADQARLYGQEVMPAASGKPLKSLADVFLPLNLRRFQPLNREEVEFIEQQADLPDRKKAYLKVVSQKAGRQEKRGQLEIKNLLKARPRLAVIGGPGCGKSTLLAFLALALARRIRLGEEFIKLPEGKEQLVPLLIPLRYYREYREFCAASPEHCLEHPCSGTLAGFIPWYIKRSSAQVLPDEFFDRLLKGGACLLMFDGLDEVVDAAERARVRAEVEELTTEQYSKNLVIVTAREAGYQKDAVFSEKFARLDVQPLDDDQIGTLCEKWCRQLYPAEAMLRRDELVAAIREINRRSVARSQDPLVSSPLLVTMVISVKYYETELPRERALLYEAVVRVILQAQYLKEDASRKEITGDWREQLDWLSLLALEMHRGGEGGAVISEEGVRAILRTAVPGQQLEQFIRMTRLRGGVFEERAEMFQFTHLTFQEFLAARRLAKGRDEAFPVLEGVIGDSWWREVFMLVYGFARSDHAPFSQKYLARLQAQDGEGNRRLGGLELAGAALLDVEKWQPELAGRVAENLAGLIQSPDLWADPAVRARAGDTLGRLGDPRFDPDFYYLPVGETLGFTEIPAGEFLMGSLINDREADEDEKPQHSLNLEAFHIARYPVTVAQFGAFLEDAGGVDVHPNCMKDPPNRPVRFITWHNASAYCSWLSRRLAGDPRTPPPVAGLLRRGWGVCLPSEAQWEKAARGAHGRIYPWGDGFDRLKCNMGETGIGDTCAAGIFPAGASPEGVLDLGGNVWEWTSSIFKEYPYDPADGREDPQSKEPRVWRGGAFVNDPQDVRCASRVRDNPYGRDLNLGFRIILSPLRDAGL